LAVHWTVRLDAVVPRKLDAPGTNGCEVYVPIGRDADGVPVRLTDRAAKV
jgi:hypothetical protein